MKLKFKYGNLPFKKNRLWKVILSIVAVGMLPLAGGGLLAVLYGKSTLISVTGEKFKDMSKQLSLHLDFLIDREIHEARNLALSKEIREAVILFNSKEGTTQRSIRSWIEIEASRRLQEYMNLKENEYEIIFVTDRSGEVVAATASLPKQNYAEEPWWQATYHHGKGAVYLGELSAGEESRSLRVDLGVPIFDSQGKQAIGVIKFVIKEMDVGKILHEVAIGKTGHAMLLREDGAVLVCPLFPRVRHQPIRIDGAPRDGWSIRSDGHGGGETVVGFSVVSLTDRFASQSLGIKPWRVVITQRWDELSVPIRRALWLFSGFGTALAGAFILLGMFAGEKLIRPILVIQQGAEILSRGNLAYRLEMNTGDELETLANTINTMAENLDKRTKELLANRDYLKNIIDQSAAFIITSDSTYRIKEFNRGAEQVFGYRRDAVIGKGLELLWKDSLNFQQAMNEVAVKGHPVSYETVFARRDGTPVAVSCSLARIKDQDGGLGIVLVGEDLTERNELAESRFQFERLMSLHRLSTVLTHDLRSPLVGILKALTLLQEKYDKMPGNQIRQLLSDLVRGGTFFLGRSMIFWTFTDTAFPPSPFAIPSSILRRRSKRWSGFSSRMPKHRGFGCRQSPLLRNRSFRRIGGGFNGLSLI